MVRTCPTFTQCQNFFGDLCDTPSTCQPNKLLGTDSSCGWVVLLDPCAVVQNCGIEDIKVKASPSDNTPWFLIDKLGICPSSSAYFTLTSNGNFADEKLLLCLTNPATTLIATTDWPWSRPTCTVWLGRPLLVGNAESPTGWDALCPSQRAIGKIRLNSSYQQGVTNNDTSFFIPNGTWTFTWVGMATASFSFSWCSGSCLNTGTNCGLVAPRTWRYMVGMKGCANVWQWVHTVRFQTAIVNTSSIIQDPPVLDDRFEWPVFRDASFEDSYANTAFDATRTAPFFRANMVRWLFWYWFWQSEPVFLNAWEAIIFIVKYDTWVDWETHTTTPSIGIHWTADNGMTNGVWPWTSIWMVELDDTIYLT